MEEKIAAKSDWQVEDMPKRHRSFIMKREFTPEQLENLRRGHIPAEMEDRWFSYFEDNKLYVHRSWSGTCIYIVEFKAKNRHVVTVNRDKKQYDNRDMSIDKETINSLLNQWQQGAENGRRDSR